MLFFRFCNRDGHWEHIEGVESYTDMLANAALDSGFQLPVELVYKYRAVSLLESVPELLGYRFIWTIVRVFLFYVWFLGYAVEIFMHSFQQYWEHFLAVVLSESLELDSLACYPVFNFPRGYSLFGTVVHVID